MRTETLHWTPQGDWTSHDELALGPRANLVFAFGSRETIEDADRFDELRSTYPHAHVVGCSTGGEILGRAVSDGALAATAVQFEHTETALAHVSLSDVEGGFDAGRHLAQALRCEGLAHVFVLSDGVHVNGSALVRGLTAYLPEGVQLTGALAADDDRFERTPIWADGVLEAPGVVAVGFYGERLHVGYGAVGGWSPFGPGRLITRAHENRLFELDGRSALALYQDYLGPYGERLPASGLRFPLALRSAEGRYEVVRTILGVDEADGSITFAGDVPEGAYARFMKTNLERLIDGAVGAAEAARAMQGAPPELALLVSCVGRKWVLRQRAEEEVEAVGDVLGRQACLVGFYSYGEIAPASRCELHNQTMTITTFAER